jgi:hypothetical protein
MKIKIIACCYLLLLFLSCKKKEQVPIDSKQAYFPVQVGKWLLYDVDSIVYNDFTHLHYTHSFQIKILYADTFRDNLNELSYRMVRYERQSSKQAFYIKDVWIAKVQPNRVEVVEENQRFIKFAFPVVLSAKWHGNTFITPDLNDPNAKFLTDWEYSFTSLDESFKLNGVTYDSVATVLEHQEEIPQLQSIEFKTIYAKHLGPIYMKRKYLEKQPIDIGWQAGFDVTYFINDHN